MNRQILNNALFAIRRAADMNRGEFDNTTAKAAMEFFDNKVNNLPNEVVFAAALVLAYEWFVGQDTDEAAAKLDTTHVAQGLREWVEWLSMRDYFSK